MHPVVKSLLSTFIISTVLATFANCAVYAYKMQGIQYAHVDTAIRIAEPTLLLTLILLITSLPALFLMSDRFWKPAIIGFLLYFIGPVAFIVAFVFMKFESPTDQLLGQLTGLIYLAVSIIFYYFVTRNYRRKNGQVGFTSMKDRVNSRIDPVK